MPNSRSYKVCSGGVMNSIAIEARNMVRTAAAPVPAGETIKGQLRRACRALGYRDGDWRIRAAWYSEAGSWSAAAFEELRERYRSWSEKQKRAADRNEQALATLMQALASRLEQNDAEFFAADIDACRDLLRRAGAGDDGKETKDA